MSTVCAIIPTYNRANYISETLDSLLAQTRPLDEIIIVNDGSTDRTLEILAPYQKDPRVRVISKVNEGKPAALNLALRECTSDYVWICDDDDLALPDGLEHLVTALDSRHDCVIAYGRFVRFSDVDRERFYDIPKIWGRPNEVSAKIRFLEGVFTNCFAVLFRRTIFDEISGFDPSLHRAEDYDILIRATRHHEGVYVPKDIYLYRQHLGARGPSNEMLTTIHEVNRKNLDYFQRVFLRARHDYDVEEFCPTFAKSWTTAQARRAALLLRGRISALSFLWNEAADDFLAASHSCSLPLHPDEEMLLMATYYDMGYNPEIRDTRYMEVLRKCCLETNVGQNIIYALHQRMVGSGVRFFLREKQYRHAMFIFSHIYRCLGGLLGTKRILSAMIRKVLLKIKK